jgi:hypothetical protein
MPKYFREQCEYTEIKLDDRTAINIEAIVKIPDIVFLQIQSDTIDKKDTCSFIGDSIKSLKKRGSFVINWTGDKRNGVPNWMFRFAENVSITGFSNEQDMNEFNSRVPNGAIFLQQGIDTNIFKPEGESVDTPEIVFLANNYGNEFPLSRYRKDVVNALQREYGSRFKVYGNGWGAGSGNVNSSQYEEAKVYRGCKIAISVSHFDSDRYFSDRLGRALCTGAFVLSHHYKGIEKDFELGTHMGVFFNIESLIKECNIWLNVPLSRDAVAVEGQKLASKEFSYQNIVKQILELG